MGAVANRFVEGRTVRKDMPVQVVQIVSQSAAELRVVVAEAGNDAFPAGKSELVDPDSAGATVVV